MYICLIRVISGLLIKPATLIDKLLYYRVIAKDCLIYIISICSINTKYDHFDILIILTNGYVNLLVH